MSIIYNRLCKNTRKEPLSINKAEFIQEVSNKHSLPKNKIQMYMDACADTLCEVLSNGESVKFVGFGEFSVKQRAARIGRNPKDNTAVKIPPQNKPVFKPGKNLLDAARGDDS